MSVRVFAPAKINLTLEVGRPRVDGYHPLQSAVMFADVGDWLEAAPADRLSLAISGPFAAGLDAGDGNLVLRAARLLDPNRGAALKLEKNLPIASGIGGGSSDAATTLIALNELWGLEHPKMELVRIAAHIGADVPVCVRKHSAWISGIGENVAAMQAPVLHAVLVNPGKPLATPAVYRRFDELGRGRDFEQRSVVDWRSADEAFSAVMLYGNNLEVPAVSLMPELEDLLQILHADPRTVCASLSGSGATCFALTRNAKEASALAGDLGARDRDWWVRATSLGAP
ncbi:MAG: 4-(cytidine 5'-diphospho)-2-C-methyl-D-erythritol kinase [Caulobacteraceae bacterium]